MHTAKEWRDLVSREAEIDYLHITAKIRAGKYLQDMQKELCPAGCVIQEVTCMSTNGEDEPASWPVMIASPIKMPLTMRRDWSKWSNSCVESLFYWDTNDRCYAYLNAAYVWIDCKWKLTNYKWPTLIDSKPKE